MILHKRYSALPMVGVGLFCLSALPSQGQNFFPNDAALNSAISGNAVVGQDGMGHNSSPTFTLLTGGYLFNGALDAYNASTVNMSGGLVPFGVTMHDSSILNLSGGVIEDGLLGTDNSILNISGGSVADDLSAAGNSRVTVSGGYILDNTLVDSSQPFTVTGGSFQNSLNTYDNSVTNIHGGDFSASGGLYINDSSLLNLFGTDLSSVLTDPDNGGDSIYTLSGKLQDGSSADGLLVGIQNGSTAQLALINITPEPGAVSLLAGMGMTGTGILLRGRRNRRK